jgi:hypothetical protein
VIESFTIESKGIMRAFQPEVAATLTRVKDIFGIRISINQSISTIMYNIQSLNSYINQVSS